MGLTTSKRSDVVAFIGVFIVLMISTSLFMTMMEWHMDRMTRSSHDYATMQREIEELQKRVKEQDLFLAATLRLAAGDIIKPEDKEAVLCVTQMGEGHWYFMPSNPSKRCGSNAIATIHFPLTHYGQGDVMVHTPKLVPITSNDH